MPSSTFSQSPIGVFDSGIGGLSILLGLRQALPVESFVYFSDAGHAPYGERSDAFITKRSLDITQHLIDTHAIKALVVACNTATTVAIHVLRERFPDLHIIGVEPAIKPACKQSKTGHIAVMATQQTLNSAKFQALAASLTPETRISTIACAGLARAIELNHQKEVEQLSQHYMDLVLQAHKQASDQVFAPVDTVVLGCTHYPLIQSALEALVPKSRSMQFIDSTQAVAQQTWRRLNDSGLLKTESVNSRNDEARDSLTEPTCQRILLETSGDLHYLQAMTTLHVGSKQGLITSAQ